MSFAPLLPLRGGRDSPHWVRLRSSAAPVLVLLVALVVASATVLSGGGLGIGLFLLPRQMATQAPIRALLHLRDAPHPPAAPSALESEPRPRDTQPRDLLVDLQRRFPGQPLVHFSDAFLQLMERKYGARAEAKLREVMDWRVRNQVDSIPRNGPRLGPEVMFWHGRDRQGRPVLYLRPALLDMTAYDSDKTRYTLMMLIEEGLERLPPGVADFILVIDTSGIGPLHFNPIFIRRIVSLLTDGYVHRIHRVVVGPTDQLVNSIWAFVDPLLPEDFRSKVLLTDEPLDLISRFVDNVPPQRMF